MVPLLRFDAAALAAAQFPHRALASRPVEPPPGQGSVDALADHILHLRLGREQHPDPDLVADALCPAVMRCQRTGRLVVPVPTQSDSYGRPGYTEIGGR